MMMHNVIVWGFRIIALLGVALSPPAWPHGGDSTREAAPILFGDTHGGYGYYSSSEAEASTV